MPLPDAPPDTPTDMSVPTWSVDSTSKKGVPATESEWSDLLQAAGIAMQPPDHLWLMQEFSGPLDDSIGAIQLTPTHSPSYRNAVPGWSRAAVGTFDVANDQGFITNATGNLDGTPYLLLVYVAVVGAPSAERAICGLGANGDHRYVSVTTTPTFKATGAGVVPTLGTINPVGEVHPVVLRLDPVQLSYVVYTDQEKLTVSWTGTAGLGGLLIIGNANIGSAPARYLYSALWTGANAMTDDEEVKKLLQALGWTVTGY